AKLSSLSLLRTLTPPTKHDLLSLHDALPISGVLTLEDSPLPLVVRKELYDSGEVRGPADLRGRRIAILTRGATPEYLLTKLFDRSEEHTSDSSHRTISYAVFCLKKKKNNSDN